MKVTCPSCGAKYAIADDKVRGRRVKVRCKSCTTPIVVDGAALEAQSSALGDDEATRMAHGAAASVGEWSVNLSDTDQRQMTTDEIIAGWQTGLITEDAFVWNESMDDWKPVLEVPELASRFFQRPASQPASAPPPAAAAAPPWQAQSPSNGASPFASGSGLGFGAAPAAAAAPAARVSGGRSQRGADLFGRAAQAGSEEDVAQHAIAPGSTPYVEQKPTGARNENSVLFSLDALKAGFAPTAQSAAPSPAAKSKSSRPPPGDSANLDDLMNLGGSVNPIFGLGANQALLHAPPPPEPPPPKPEIAPASLVPSVGYAPAPQKSNKTLMMALVAAVGVILVLGVGLAVALGGGDADKEKLAETSGDDSKKSGSGESSSGSSKESGDKGEAKKDEGESKSGDTSAAATDEKTPVTEEDKKRFAEAQKKKEEEESKDKTEDKKDEPEKKSLGTFSRSAAVSALTSAASAASGCKRPGGPTGTGKAIVTFAPSGRVTSANVTGGSFGGTSVGGCIASVFRSAKIPAFDGDPVTVSKSFTISP